ncbi:MmpS family transport accessory protein [Galbibacter pacificus]|uniref:MmpS family transport accessory protein n=1 Tax=Galbibacter pacificus TaxID=2996052 RepID=A0ABT6FRQ7_9FLAO|nr:MmpS family transport accessory protein [Galbibacter pacificus]MDG3582919.1 MmpS family transport accessory protein [Galbibacter pacificus]MDG3585962.1 MmpS family transport accessory protein [Galbibacter pacificus]
MKHTRSILLLASILALLFTFTSCSEDDDSTPQPRNIKYEITGNYGGRLTVSFADKSGNIQTINVNSLPWSESLSIDSDISAIALSAGNSGVDNPGESGETITLKIYRNEEAVEESTATATNNGFIELGISYSFDL